MRKPLLAAGVASLAIVNAARAVELYNNGSFVTGTSPGGNTISQIDPGYDTFGLVAGGYSANPQRVADNFVISSGGWDLDTLTVYGYQSGGVVNPFTSAYLGVFDFDPTGLDNLAPRHGSLDPFSAANVFVSQVPLNIFRVSAANPDDVSRHVHSVTLDLSSLPVLPPGEYWFAVGLQGTTSTSVVAAVPVTPTPGNADGLSYGRIRHAIVGRENFWQYADGSIGAAEDPNLIQPYDHAFKLDGTTVAVNEWALSGGGDYSAPAPPWTQGTIPDGVDAVANFMGSITAPSNINVNSPITLGKINFNNPKSYTLVGSGPITLQASVGGANINALGGSHTIITPIMVPGDLGLLAAQPGAQLQINSGIDTPAAVIKRGSGMASVGYVRSQVLHIRNGTLRIAPNGTSAGTSNVKQLNIERLNDTPRGKLDITNNAFVVDYTPVEAEPFDTIKALIISGLGSGAWDGTGITSSSANTSTHGIGYAEASALTSVPAIFGTVDATAVLFRLTRYGDANLDGQVNLQDFNRLAANFGATEANWDQGDFTYDGSVNLQDFNRLAANFGLSASPEGPTPEDWANLAAAVPEPSLIVFIAVGTAGFLQRNRRPLW